MAGTLYLTISNPHKKIYRITNLLESNFCTLNTQINVSLLLDVQIQNLKETKVFHMYLLKTEKLHQQAFLNHETEYAISSKISVIFHK